MRPQTKTEICHKLFNHAKMTQRFGKTPNGHNKNATEVFFK